MGIFSKPEVVIYKESNDAKEYLAKLETLLDRASGNVKSAIEKEIISGYRCAERKNSRSEFTGGRKRKKYSREWSQKRDRKSDRSE